MNLLKRLRDDERGLATVEAAIALPVLLFVLFGIMEGGLLIFTKHQMDRASREAARYCSLYTPDLDLDENKARCTTGAPAIIGQTLAGTNWTATPSYPIVGGAQAAKISISKPLPLTATFFTWAPTLSSSTTVVADWSS